MCNLVAIVLSLATSATADVGRPAQTNRLPPDAYRNQYGLPVLDANERRLNYSRQEIEAAAARAPALAAPKAMEARAPGVNEPAFTAQQVWAYAAFWSGIGQSNIVVAAKREPGDLPGRGDHDVWHGRQRARAAVRSGDAGLRTGLYQPVPGQWVFGDRANRTRAASTSTRRPEL